MASRWAKSRYRCLELWAIFGPSSYSFNPFVLNFSTYPARSLFFFASSRHAMNTRDKLFPQSASPELVMTREPSTYGKHLHLHIHHMATSTSRSSPLYSKCLP
ncbi:hypothetical protein HOY82DRAFT_630647 [Tuber indicum]|nr:hypothetical protein HOY82DRAFT_630647 [Tuber indicum]